MEGVGETLNAVAVPTGRSSRDESDDLAAAGAPTLRYGTSFTKGYLADLYAEAKTIPIRR
jgi:hypothetical protein